MAFHVFLFLLVVCLLLCLVELIRKNGDSKVGDYTLGEWAACSKASGLRYCNVECKRTGL